MLLSKTYTVNFLFIFKCNLNTQRFIHQIKYSVTNLMFEEYQEYLWLSKLIISKSKRHVYTFRCFFSHKSCFFLLLAFFWISQSFFSLLTELFNMISVVSSEISVINLFHLLNFGIPFTMLNFLFQNCGKKTMNQVKFQNTLGQNSHNADYLPLLN